MNDIVNLLTVDLEEWYVVEVLSGRYKFSEWPHLQSTVVRNSRSLLRMFGRHDVRATWFVLGWCADKFPDLIAEIAGNGHEIACHSYRHRRVDSLDQAAFREDTEKAVEAIDRAAGARPIGYRAPSWSINASVPWAFDMLADMGFEYDSSIFPIKHDIYGMQHAPRTIFRMDLKNGRSLYEVPASTFRLLGRNIPLAGGGYLRHSPYWYSRRLIRKLNTAQQPAVVYIHPWEIDPEPPKVSGLTAMQRFRNYGSTSIFGLKIERLLGDFEFTTVSDYLYSLQRRRIGFQ